ncbi:esterase [Flaviaesturariibacter flavus]|uniref:Esterase n=2 Tax=Flaviaesturariibacter flavus TaxID=2502780 RepID=A0A4R1B3M1_9BACT|nr:esterase [Flaviaesturariibacter flavus]
MTDATIKQATEISDSAALQYLVREPQVKSPKNKAIILLHGVGSNEQDLFSLASQLPNDFYIIAPRGQYTLGAGRYAWYNVDFSTGKPVYNTDQELSSRKAIGSFIRQVKEKYDLDEIYLGGFSQGAIMSYSIGLLYPNEVKGVIAFSGRLLEELKPLVKKGGYLQELKVFVAHGMQDNTLPIHYAREAKHYIESLGIKVSYHEYTLGHQISSEVVRDLNSWLID